MSERKLRLAVVGVGWWANSVHVRQIRSHPGAQVVALCGRTPEKLQRAGAEFGVTRLYADHEKLLADGDLDAVTISTTHNAHYEIARAALEAGLHVFCEKPLGVNSRQTAQLVRLAEEKRLKTMVAFTNRWVPEAMHARRLISGGFCGEAFHYNCCQLAGYGRPGSGWAWRFDPDLAGGGVLFDLGCHNIDLAMWLNGPISRVCGMLKNTSPRRLRSGELLPTPCDDTDAFVAEFANGSQGIFHISWTSPGDRIMRHEIAGSEGFLALGLYHDVWINGLSGCKAGEPQLSPLPPPDDLQGEIPRAVATPQEREAAHDAFLDRSPSLVRAFLDCLRADTDPTPSFADGHAAQQVMDAVVTSHREARWVAVSVQK